ncbi:MAG TPA: methylenetetrahydrofolate--tRNA-(uracil(54)-C(5))-methyltransferase (FADH(2)-oxidizing) TrmFO [Syntrophales bacterium]|nr:methylenetetrahydrofolate--tRNA-(uracil(54)-C(5))-methyltransferase (FADH(2)-oxidizing) TrmFO [Syntrophales bacterium]HQG35216.1 methylenetetrahydrofolate--tRNA-(uracil(54)-C(5))-methyltransferase (FADH(2)-oxidizing) TrmFO [Syntrophales bacterium]HQI35172.1 methylenetetrahydrofolate--tRNA-(uracil(54)-C(5))-methyltransferase (FADH(2)-oxidizing) TrmFO [Syntrophales bacterium]HQJ30881.1 methylenetetrahydrofolate--tRNA-(uracil(54)-C(5))-methyltransferase (FADH(2)-oxidizing) TrmFO [Syntrophales ba
MPPKQEAVIIGGGLAGCEAAWQLLCRGCRVTMYEMKPGRYSPAHTSPLLAELVCSNSLRSADPTSAAGMLKEEMRSLNSLFMAAAEATSVPAGRSLAVDRRRFSQYIQERLSGFAGQFQLLHREIREIIQDKPVIIATGPLTSDALAAEIQRLTGAGHLYFYDAIAPIIITDSIDLTQTFWASRYDHPQGEANGDYLNCPLDETAYNDFREAILSAAKVPLRDFENPQYFEGCLPVEILAERGPRTLLFGPMKPVGLTDPRTGRQPYAVIQLRKENRAGTLLNMVGFQTKMTWPEQQRVFRMIPGLSGAEFARYGSIHRNTFLNAPVLLTERLQLRSRPQLLFAGQLTGVEGYVESAAMGLYAGLSLWFFLNGRDLSPPPDTTAMGALISYLTTGGKGTFQPMNVNHGILRPLTVRLKKSARGMEYARRSRADLLAWKIAHGIEDRTGSPS